MPEQRRRLSLTRIPWNAAYPFRRKTEVAEHLTVLIHHTCPRCRAGQLGSRSVWQANRGTMPDAVGTKPQKIREHKPRWNV